MVQLKPSQIWNNLHRLPMYTIEQKIPKIEQFYSIAANLEVHFLILQKQPLQDLIQYQKHPEV